MFERSVIRKKKENNKSRKICYTKGSVSVQDLHEGGKCMWKKKLAGMLLTACVAIQLSGTSFGMVGDLVNGQYVYNNGSPIEGALEKGVSISKYQNRAGAIDWEAVKADGVSFALVRMGYLNDLDPHFEENMRNAAAHGIKTGAYLYSQAIDLDTAVKEAQFFIEYLKEYPVSYPVALDFESQYILDAGLSVEQMTAIVNVFCKTVADAGYLPMLYGNNEWLTRHVDVSQIPYDIWYSRYYTDQHDFPNRGIWQCIDTGKVNGITGDVTLELAFKDYSAQIPSELWRQINGKWYYFKDYNKQTGWLNLGDTWYYLDETGAMLSDTTAVIDGISYTFDASGALQ